MSTSARLRCVLTLPMERVHTFQIVAGFVLLQRAGLLDLEVQLRPETRRSFPSTFMVQAEVGEGIKLAYDVHDGSDFEHPENAASYLEEVDFYFKRSYDPEIHDKGPHAEKIRPLGFNYLVIARHPFFARRLLENPLRTVRTTVGHLVGYETAHYFGLGGPYARQFEDVPRRVQAVPKVMFLTRTYGSEHFVSSEERDELNEMRASCIRLLRREFGEAFTGGFKPTTQAKHLYPDCVVPRSAIAKNHYLRTVRDADICVTTRGIAESNGWKIAEYIAASKGIVSETLRHLVPGDFTAGRNYLSFESPEQCLAETLRLATDPNLLEEMRWRNYRYYQRFLRPDQLVLNSLTTAMGCEENDLLSYRDLPIAPKRKLGRD